MRTSNHFARWIVCGILILSSFFDATTFLLHSKFWMFEINPIYLATKSILLLIGLKLLVTGAYGILLIKPELIKSDVVRYVVVISTVYAILFQILGGIANLQTVAANPTPEQVMAPAVATKTYLSVMLLQAVAPILMGTLSFWLFKKMGYDDKKEKEDAENESI